jgi:hypothetical protein
MGYNLVYGGNPQVVLDQSIHCNIVAQTVYSLVLIARYTCHLVSQFPLQDCLPSCHILHIAELHRR